MGTKNYVGSLTVNGNEVITEIEAISGTNINSVGTPSVEASTVDGKTTLTFNNLKGATGAKGDDGTSVSIVSISESDASGDESIVTFSDGKTLSIYNGNDGVTPTIKAQSGANISSVGTPSVTATTSGTTTTFTFNNLKGEKGDKGDNATTTAVATQDANGLMSSTDKKTLDTLNALLQDDTDATINTIAEVLKAFETMAEGANLATLLGEKVDKVTGKGLSTNDFTTAYKTTLDSLAKVATSGSYNDLSGKPTIPTATSQLTNNSDFATNASVDTKLGNKVDKVSGKGLSTNDYTTDEKTKLSGIASGAEVNVQSDWNETDATSDAFIKNKPTIPSAITNPLTLSSQSNYNANTCYDGKVWLIASGSNCPSGSQFGSLFTMPYRQATGNTKPDFATQIFIPNGDDSTKPNSMFYRTALRDSWNAWQEVATTNVVTTSANGIMSASDKSKLDGIETGANKITVDTALSSTSTNPVQNKLIYTALALKASTSAVTSLADRVTALENAGSGSSPFEIIEERYSIASGDYFTLEVPATDHMPLYIEIYVEQNTGTDQPPILRLFNENAGDTIEINYRYGDTYSIIAKPNGSNFDFYIRETNGSMSYLNSMSMEYIFLDAPYSQGWSFDTEIVVKICAIQTMA